MSLECSIDRWTPVDNKRRRPWAIDMAEAELDNTGGLLLELLGLDKLGNEPFCDTGLELRLRLSISLVRQAAWTM